MENRLRKTYQEDVEVYTYLKTNFVAGALSSMRFGCHIDGVWRVCE